LAHHAPQAIESLTVACSRLEMDPAATAMWQQRAKQVEEQGMAPIAAATLERWLTPDFMSTQPEKTQQIRQTLIDTPPQGFAACARALADMHQLERLAGLQVRTLFIGGSKDMAVPCETVKQYALMNPLFSFHALEGPHILNMENPIGFQQTITDFISQR
jgi:pimeloyl-ACP methyl ester carboxylesterase